MRRQETVILSRIFVCGIDGSGKTALAQDLIEELKRQGFNARYVWMRYNHYFVKPLLAFCRIIRLTQYRQVGDIKIGVHLFYKSTVISFLFVALTFVDTALATFLKLWLRRIMDNSVVICDRYIVDIIIDLMIDIKNPTMFKGFWGNAFKRLLPEHEKTFYIRRPLEEVLQVRPELKYDHSLDLRISLYEQLVKHWNISVINNNGTLLQAHKEMLKELSFN